MAVQWSVKGETPAISRLACGLLTVMAAALSLSSAVCAQNSDPCEGCGYNPTPVEVDVTAVPIVVTSTTDDYLVLYVKHDVDGTELELPVLVKLGEAGTTTLAENIEALPAERYRVEKYLIADPADVDGDCIDDVTELADLGSMNPVNPAPNIDLSDGAVAIPDAETFKALCYNSHYIKFVLFDMNTDRPRVYFHNTTTHPHHWQFLQAVGLDQGQVGLFRGLLNYDQEMLAPDGGQGVYRYSPLYQNENSIPPYSSAVRFHTVLAASVPCSTTTWL